MRKINAEGLELIKRYEGLKFEPYVCPGGYLTIGYGHLIKEDEEFYEITSDKAEDLLLTDIKKFEILVDGFATKEINNNQFSALVSWTFNLGPGNLQKSTLLKKVNNLEHEDVPAEFIRWVYAGGQKMRGLLKRRLEEALLYVK